jgi:hypothetical protein
MFEQFSAIWILVSSLIGGIVGASIKFLFDKILSGRYSKNNKAKEALEQYSFPLLQSTKSLHQRLDFIIKNQQDRDLYNESNHGYSLYKLSTLYCFCHFFGAGTIIQEEALGKFHFMTKRAMQFYNTFYDVYKGFSSMYYFKESNSLKGTYAESTIPSYVLSAIGEQMIERTNGDTHIKIIGFQKFVILVQENCYFNTWIKYLDNLLSGVNFDKERKDWNRIVVIAIHVRLLEGYLDKKRKFTLDKKLHEYFELLDKDVQKKFIKDLEGLKKIRVIKTIPKTLYK